MRAASQSRSIQECFAENVRRLRNAQGSSLKKFAEEFGVSVSFLQSLESGKKWVSPATVKKLATAFGVSESELFRDCGADALPDPRFVVVAFCEAMGVELPRATILSAPLRR